MPEIKDEKSKKKKYFEKWTTPIKKSDFKNIYNYVADLVNNEKVFRINDNEVITAIPLTNFITDINNDKFDTRNDAIEYFSKRIYPEYESKLNLMKDGGAEEIKSAYNRVKNMIYNPAEQQGQGVKILTPKQLITKLPFLLAQLQAGNNPQNLKMK